MPFTKRETCTEEILDILLRPVAGYKVLTDLCLTDELGRIGGGADVVMIHESGILQFIPEFPGSDLEQSGGRYWITVLPGGLNFFPTAIICIILSWKIMRILDRMQWGV